ncbi:hypothetical protein Bca101_057468 [Brassica carinata]
MAEQQSGSTRHAFFGFNGTAGVWRIAAMEEAGGWKDRTTVEDMDLAVRVGLLGWKFVFINDVEVKSELPSQFKAFRFQQHRWSCGPANLFRKMTMEIIHNQSEDLEEVLCDLQLLFPKEDHNLHSFTFFFYCVMAMHRTKGTLIGLFEGGIVNEWVVTEKLGDSLTTELLPQLRKPDDDELLDESGKSVTQVGSIN